MSRPLSISKSTRGLAPRAARGWVVTRSLASRFGGVHLDSHRFQFSSAPAEYRRPLSKLSSVSSLSHLYQKSGTTKEVAHVKWRSLDKLCPPFTTPIQPIAGPGELWTKWSQHKDSSLKLGLQAVRDKKFTMMQGRIHFRHQQDQFHNDLRTEYGEFWMWRLRCCVAVSSKTLATQCQNWLHASEHLVNLCEKTLRNLTYQVAQDGDRRVPVVRINPVRNAIVHSLWNGDKLAQEVRSFLFQNYLKSSKPLETAGRLLDTLVDGTVAEAQRVRGQIQKHMAISNYRAASQMSNRLIAKIGSILLQRQLCEPTRSAEKEARLLNILAFQSLGESARLYGRVMRYLKSAQVKQYVESLTSKAG